MTIDSSALRSAAAIAAGGQQYPAGTLYVVATPIGNLADLGLRAIHVLGLVDAVACEDTRVTGGLLRHLGIDRPLIAAHQHNERVAAETVVSRLAQQQRVAYVSDAGTPGLSDPGAVLVAAAAAAGHRVMPIPGASSALALLSVAGDVAGPRFRFVGFVGTRGAEREAALEQSVDDPQTQVLFEAPHRIAALAATLAARCPDRAVTVGRELTKQFESVVTMPASALPAWLAADAHRSRGEFALVLHARPPRPASAGDAEDDPATTRLLSVLLRELPLKQAVALATEISGRPRNALYAQALALRPARDA